MNVVWDNRDCRGVEHSNRDSSEHHKEGVHWETNDFLNSYGIRLYQESGHKRMTLVCRN